MDLQEIKVKLESESEHASAALVQVGDLRELEDWRTQYLGKKSEITQMSRVMGSLSPEDRPLVGALVNDARSKLQSAYDDKKSAVEADTMAAKFASETLDVTLSGRSRSRGAMHPIIRIMSEIEDVFLGMGFQIADGPEVETDEYNFVMLNFPKDHPARDMQDTFYLTEELLLRTHTSPMQVRTMQRMRQESPDAPVKVIVPGRVYRRDEDDATHSHAFTQVEGLVVGEGIRMSDLKGILEEFARAIFGPNQAVRLRPSFFPFTEPSAEVDVRCVACDGDGCRLCKHTGWIEILGAGMVHPNVLDGAGYDSSKYSGFAFGMGPERIAMLKYGIEDIRQLYQNDLRLLHQFRSLP